MSKAINMEKVYKKTHSVSKKIKVKEAVMGLEKTLSELVKNGVIKLDNDTRNIIVTYFSLRLLATTHDQKEYDEMFNSFLDEEEIKESEA